MLTWIRRQKQSIADIRASLENQKKAELSSLKKPLLGQIMTLEKEYSENHETLAAGILKQMIEG